MFICLQRHHEAGSELRYSKECERALRDSAAWGLSQNYGHQGEKTYNTGCNYDNVGDLTSAEKAAREDKVGIIKVQRVYVTKRQGRDKEAQTIYNQMLRNKPIDIWLTAVASNNLIAINKDQKTRIQDLLSSSFFLHLGQLSLGLLSLGAGVLEPSCRRDRQLLCQGAKEYIFRMSLKFVCNF